MKYELPQLVSLGRNVCGSLELAERYEWWLANGKGGYAGGTVAGTLTRRYHGLLIVPLQSYLQRYLLFAKADAEILDGDTVIPLYTNRWGSGSVEPRGHLFMESFRLDGRMPVWHYRLDDLLIEARIWMEHGRHSTCLAWRLLENPAGRKVMLRVKLLTNVRDHRGITDFENYAVSIRANDHEIDVSYPGDPTLRFNSRCGVAQLDEYWIEDFDLPAERDRGLPSQDRHLCIGYMTFPIYQGHWVGLTATIEENEPAYYMEDAMRRFQEHDLAILTHSKITVPELTDAPGWIDQLVLAADNFVIRSHKNDGHEQGVIIEGYPWLGDWMRESLVALPGLLLATGHYQQARGLLLSYLPLVDNGMLPDCFPISGRIARYDSADIALWYIEAWYVYYVEIKDLHSVAVAWPVLQQIITYYRSGTRHGIGMDCADGLMCAGEIGMSVTWMDTKANDGVIRPRIGKQVEINALWYNALQVMVKFAHVLKDELLAQEFVMMAETTRRGFKKFIRADRCGLFDVLEGSHDNEPIRPNQLFAVSLSFSPLALEVQREIVAACARFLLTPDGLRSLSQEYPDYCSNYQGTVWIWLLGHYVWAENLVNGNIKYSWSLLDGIKQHLKEFGLGTISKIFEGDAPHSPRGGPAEAWSVACILEVWRKLARAQSHDRENPLASVMVSRA